MRTASERLHDRIANSTDDREAVALLLAAHADDAADALAELPVTRRAALMAALPERARKRIAILAGDEPAIAGSLMIHEFLVCYSDATVAHALERIRASDLDDALTAVVFIVNRERRLIGSATCRRLLAGRPASRCTR